ncbi:GRAS domain-containing protein [Citrus sinensis]|uniref:GRAS domain-containing protein n=1 Tax=Citrus sinensis TaxID=2711 RepID=A0ACB8I9V3_CITSI|nr:GRAS domain-containing protein [Citrus sinensis]
MAGFRELSTVDVIRAATAIYLQSSSHSSSNLSLLDHFCGGSAINISEEESKDVELVHLLILCAEKIGSQQFDRASTLLDHCENFSSKIGNSVERVVHYFVKALQERFNRETGKITSKRVKGEEIQLLQPEETILSLRPALVACYKESSFYQATLFAGTQAIIERVASAKRIHLIDLAIRSGSHCIVLMQALATRQECPVELLKITAVGSSSKQRMEETGKRLAYFAETWNLPFSFKIVLVTETKDLNEDKFDLNAGEAVAVYSPILLSRTRHPDFLIKMLRKISPCVMVVIEVEANHTSQNFEDRFFEVLFHYSASFDCLKVSMARCDPERVTFEEMYLGVTTAFSFCLEVPSVWEKYVDETRHGEQISDGRVLRTGVFRKSLVRGGTGAEVSCSSTSTSSARPIFCKRHKVIPARGREARRPGRRQLARHAPQPENLGTTATLSPESWRNTQDLTEPRQPRFPQNRGVTRKISQNRGVTRKIPRLPITQQSESHTVWKKSGKLGFRGSLQKGSQRR